MPQSGKLSRPNWPHGHVFKSYMLGSEDVYLTYTLGDLVHRSFITEWDKEVFKIN